MQFWTLRAQHYVSNLGGMATSKILLTPQTGESNHVKTLSIHPKSPLRLIFLTTHFSTHPVLCIRPIKISHHQKCTFASMLWMSNSHINAALLFLNEWWKNSQAPSDSALGTQSPSARDTVTQRDLGLLPLHHVRPKLPRRREGIIAVVAGAHALAA